MKLAERANTGLHAHVISRVLAAVPNRSAGIVDIGCGTGALLASLHSQGYSNLAGVDIAPPAKLHGVRLHALDLDDPKLPFPDHSIDLVLSVEVVEHVENQGAYLAEIHRILKSDGVALLTTPNVHSVEARLRLLFLGKLKQFDAIGDPTHIQPVFLFPFTRLLARHHLVVAKSWGFPEDGSSPTSRGWLRSMAGIARRLGLKGLPDGDQLCMWLAPDGSPPGSTPARKQDALTAHYQSAGQTTR